MKLSSNKTLFALSFLAGLGIALALAGYDRWANRAPQSVRQRVGVLLTEEISVSTQIKPETVAGVAAAGFGSIIDLRPDGEAPDQAPAAVIERAARAAHLEFVYVPVPHGDIPASAVTALAKAIDSVPRPILLYCRSGRRAARTWSLVEASRPDGMDVDAILYTVHESGQSAEDLKPAILQRIAQRAHNAGKTP